MYFLIEDDELLEKYDTIWDKVSADIEKNLIASLSAIKNFWKPKLDSALKKDENYYPQVFLKECNYIEEKVVRHINDNLSDFSSSDESDENQVNDFWKCIFWGSNFLREHFWKCLLKNTFFFNTRFVTF